MAAETTGHTVPVEFAGYEERRTLYPAPPRPQTPTGSIGDYGITADTTGPQFPTSPFAFS
jgi:hypothetical protein